MELTVLDSLKENEKCVFCRHNEINELHYGKMYKFENIITHYFCMLFSSNMEQNGEDDQGILGFLPKDIKKEVFRGSKLTCSYCQHTGATIGCTVKSCKKKFHYPCGIQHGSLHLFYGQFRSYCYAHRLSQSIPQSAIKLTEKSICVMCQDEVTAKPLLSTVWAPCCKTTWLHRVCVQRMAINAGYFFKCPNCNNKDVFRKEMLECGVYIPDQDAAWELEPNAYNELTERYNKCDALNCLCPNGRNFSEAGLDYEVILCSFCGSQGIHNKCGEDYFDSKGQWTCTFCSSVVKNSAPKIDICSPGPSDVSRKTASTRRSQNLRKEPCESSQSEILNSRKRTRSTDSNEESSLCKIPAIASSVTDANEPIHLLDSSGEQIEVIRLENLSIPNVEIGGVKINQPDNIDNSIVQIDSDDDESVIDESVNKNIVTEKPATIENCNQKKHKVIPDTAPSIFIDLLDDSDEEESSQPTAANTNLGQLPITNGPVCNSDNNNDDDDDDDVIFVCCDPPPESRLPKENDSTALIRIIDNDRVYIATPMQIRSSNLDLFGNNNVENPVTINSMNQIRTNFRIIPNERPMRNFVWQSVPLHKSNANNFPQPQLPQIISAMSLENSNSIISNNNNAGSNYISKENESNSWMARNESEIIDLD